MTDRRPRFQMRPVQDDPSVVEERLVRRSHRHRTWLRIMARARRGTRRFGRSIVLTVLVLAAGLFPNVLHATPGKTVPSLSQQKQSVAIHPSSFNHRVARFDTSYLVRTTREGIGE